MTKKSLLKTIVVETVTVTVTEVLTYYIDRNIDSATVTVT